MATNHQWYHVNYSDAYKGILTLTDVGIFSMIWILLKRLRTRKDVIVVSLLYYSLITAKANHFIYDSFDLLFIAAIVLGLVAPLFWKRRGSLISWISYMAALALKYVNGPLGLLMAVTERKSWKKLIIEGLIATLLIWGLPVAYFRSSLLVTFEYHKQRGLQIESAPATLVRTIDVWTKSEHAAEVAKAYDIQGPISTQVARIFKLVFPLSLITYILATSIYLWKRERTNTTVSMIWITLGYIALFMIVSPVLSTPYLLWHIPLVAMIPAKTLQQKLLLITPSLMVVILGMTPIPNIPFGPLPLHIWIGWAKVIGFSLILVQVYRHLRLAK
jgi:hypothetical protein